MIGKRPRCWSIVALGVAAALAGCIDPGCIRNSECGPRHQCIEAACVLRQVDGGTPGSGDDEDAGTD